MENPLGAVAQFHVVSYLDQVSAHAPLSLSPPESAVADVHQLFLDDEAPVQSDRALSDVMTEVPAHVRNTYAQCDQLHRQLTPQSSHCNHQERLFHRHSKMDFGVR